ncbi:MAG: ATP-binding protein [Lachnospiraceae bacterium]|nr:ATP-binding protein [Lachnospiraceae bacterium]
MMESIVRLSSLKISNIKNVRAGQIVMPNTCQTHLTYKTAEVLGLYGQNGSGKTAVIDTLYYLQKIMIGSTLEEEIADYIDVASNQAEIIADFNIFIETIIYEVSYRIILHRNGDGANIVRETLSCAINKDDSRSNKTVFMDYQRSQQESVFVPKKRLDEVIETNAENKTDLIVARKIAEKSNCSYIFGEGSREIFCRDYENHFKNYSEVIKSLFQFALKDLFVIRNTHSGVISANFLLPMAFKIEQNEIGMKGDFAVPLTEPVVLNEERKKVLDTIVEQINMVLYTIIPGMKIDVYDYGMQLTDSGENGYRVELVSVRENMPPIPIRMESEGIIKIISILNALIQAFGNPSICLAVDELDAGIFEYMLGELLDIFNKSAKGQLIFTSHNLRALEMLDKNNIMFSTVNPKRRYIRMKNVKASNNLRDTYIRGITLGGQDEIIYEETDSLRIARAFRKAGRTIQHE